MAHNATDSRNIRKECQYDNHSKISKRMIQESCPTGMIRCFKYMIYTSRQTDRQTDRQTGRQTDRQTDRLTDRQRDRQKKDRNTDSEWKAGSYPERLTQRYI